MAILVSFLPQSRLNWTHLNIICQESNELFSKTLGWLNEYHKENIQLSNKDSIVNVKFKSKQTSIGIIAKEILVYLQKHCNVT